MASNNSSKTAHVMNLLSKNRGSATGAPQDPKAEAVPQAAAAPQAEPAATHAAPIISSLNADAAVSSQIKDALEAELEEGVKAAPVQQAAPAQQAAPVQQAAAPQAEAVSQAAAVPQTEAVPQETAVPQAQAASQTPAPEEEPPKPGVPAEEHAFVNVMEILVDEKADEYMKMFGICCCDKCRIDVRAFALNHLPPKYVVLSEHERVPRLTVYESRFASDITAQLITACKKVMLTPHHTRKDD